MTDAAAALGLARAAGAGFDAGAFFAFFLAGCFFAFFARTTW
jgi:hypothetical protein